MDTNSREEASDEDKASEGEEASLARATLTIFWILGSSAETSFKPPGTPRFTRLDSGQRTGLRCWNGLSAQSRMVWNGRGDEVENVAFFLIVAISSVNWLFKGVIHD